MAVERNRLEAQAEIRIIGDGSIGDKAQQLANKTPKLREIGFSTPRRTFLAEDFFDDFFRQNRLGASLRLVTAPGDLPEKISEGSLSQEEMVTVQLVCSSYGSAPLAVRSSGEGDARGTGIYKTEFTDNDLEKVAKALIKVLASYFSRDARTFRRDAQVGEDFGVIIEPIIGQEFGHLFAPVLSGFGYTSTSRGEGYINVVPGLGGGVETRDGERILKKDLEPFDGNLRDYIEDIRQQFNLGTMRRKSELLRNMRIMQGLEYFCNAFVSSMQYQDGYVAHTSIDFEELLGGPFYNVNLLKLFEMTARMEQAFGKPQYFEWAMTLDGQEERFWITQIADVDKKLDLVDFERFGESLLMGHTVTGTGVKDCVKIADCWNPDDIDALQRFNAKNNDYVLLYSSRLTTRGLRDVRKLQYSDFNNASVFIEIQDADHIGSPVAHLGGQLDVTGKFFGVLDYHAEIPPNFDRLFEGQMDEDGLKVYQGKLKVVASERQNKIVVYEQE